MVEKSRKALLLVLMLVFAFAYRFLLLTWDTYPPGADIGMHESIVNSIMPGQTNFVTNYYHMGGGVSVTNPGFHIFVSFVKLMTGIPDYFDYLVQTIVVCLFSTFIVLCSFLITRKVWSESASYVVAFLVALSTGDIAMLTWAGYPNVITLMIIPVIFYLYLQQSRFSKPVFIGVNSLLVAAIFLTHSLSALMFIVIVVFTAFLASIFSRRIGVPKRTYIFWFVPIILGGLLAAPYLLELVPLYFGSQGTLTGGVSAITEALLSTRLIPIGYVLLSVIPSFVFLLLSKASKGKFITLPAILFVMWILIPIVATQSYLAGIYLDYNRFLYFLALPVMIFVGFAIDHESRFFSRILDRVFNLVRKDTSLKMPHFPRFATRAASRLTRRNMYSGFVLIFLGLALVVLPLINSPNVGIAATSFYQVMTDPGYGAIDWVRTQTPENSVLVTDALYGWWVSGFAKRPTLSAVDPQYLILAREFEPADAAKNLLDTDYMVDNGLIQIREDGGYIGRHNPIFLAKIKDYYFPYPFFDFNNSEAIITLRKGNDVQLLPLMQVPVVSMYMYNKTGTNSVTIYQHRANDLFSFIEETTVTQNSGLVNMTISLESVVPDVTLDFISLVLHTKNFSPVNGSNWVALVDPYMKVCGKLIFEDNRPDVLALTSENHACLQFTYNLHGKSEGSLQLSVGVAQFVDNNDSSGPHVDDLLYTNATAWEWSSSSTIPIDVYDYRSILSSWNISYILLRDPESVPRFANDPTFRLVFINKAVAIFMVKNNQG
jgi:hypothetical protein